MQVTGLSKQLMKHLYEEHGKDISRWPEDLRDLVNPKIEARSVSPPISGKVAEFINTDYHYHWAFDRDGQTPDHERVESMIYAGWEFANTDDVKMASEDAVKGRKERPGKPSKDGRMGFSDEIRSGDRRLMKLPMRLWRENKKAQTIAAYQMAYPQPFGNDGQPMSAQGLIPGLKSEMMDESDITEARRTATPANSVTIQKEKGDK
jgi:hypothetical protein